MAPCHQSRITKRPESAKGMRGRARGGWQGKQRRHGAVCASKGEATLRVSNRGSPIRKEFQHTLSTRMGLWKRGSSLCNYPQSGGLWESSFLLRGRFQVRGVAILMQPVRYCNVWRMCGCLDAPHETTLRDNLMRQPYVDADCAVVSHESVRHPRLRYRWRSMPTLRVSGVNTHPGAWKCHVVTPLFGSRGDTTTLTQPAPTTHLACVPVPQTLLVTPATSWSLDPPYVSSLTLPLTRRVAGRAKEDVLVRGVATPSHGQTRRPRIRPRPIGERHHRGDACHRGGGYDTGDSHHRARQKSGERLWGKLAMMLLGLSSAASAYPVACESRDGLVVVRNEDDVAEFIERVNCSYGLFDVTWRGSLTLEEPIVIGNDTTVLIRGIGSGGVLDGGGTTRIIRVRTSR